MRIIRQKLFNEEQQDNGNNGSTVNKVLGAGALAGGAAAIGGLGYMRSGVTDLGNSFAKNVTNDQLGNWSDKILNAKEGTLRSGFAQRLNDVKPENIKNVYGAERATTAIMNRDKYTKVLENAVKANPENKIAADRLAAMKKVNTGLKVGKYGALAVAGLGLAWGGKKLYDKFSGNKSNQQ